MICVSRSAGCTRTHYGRFPTWTSAIGLAACAQVGTDQAPSACLSAPCFSVTEDGNTSLVMCNHWARQTWAPCGWLMHEECQRLTSVCKSARKNQTGHSFLLARARRPERSKAPASVGYLLSARARFTLFADCIWQATRQLDAFAYHCIWVGVCARGNDETTCTGLCQTLNTPWLVRATMRLPFLYKGAR